MLQRYLKENIHVMFCGGDDSLGSNMFCWFLADIVCSMPLSIGTLKIYVTNICIANGPKILSSQMLRLKLLLLIFIQE